MVCEELWQLGRWEEMHAELRQIDMLSTTGLDAWRTAQLSAERAAGEADFATAHAHLDRLRGLLGPTVEVAWQIELANLEVEIALWEGDLVTAFASGRQGMDIEAHGPLCADSHSASSLPLNAMAVATERTMRATKRDRDALVQAREHAERVATRFHAWVRAERWGHGRPGDVEPTARQVEAELALAHGRGDAGEWSALAEDWRALGMLPRVAYANWREAGLRLAVGDRGAARIVAAAGHALAEAIGWRWVGDGLADLARRGRLEIVTVDPDVPDAVSALGLTPREIDVLRLVAAGNTNRQIAELLFVSTKTASAHVSNVLAKLGVTNRAEAGAAARRLDLD